jgi:Domain of unknown function (DUF4190)
VSSNPPQTEISGQQNAPGSVVPHAPGLPGESIATTSTNSLAIVSLVTGGLSFFAHVVPGGGFVVALVAIITGFMARSEIKRTGQQGMWMANTGIILGFVHFALALLVALFVLVLIFVLGVALFGISTHSGSTPTPVPSGG